MAAGPTALPSGVTEPEAIAYLDQNLTSDLLHIFQECGVPLGLQYRLGQHFKNVKRFSAYADDRSQVRQALKDDHALEPTDQGKRAAVSSVISAWESCREYSSKENELKTEARVLGTTRPVTQTERQAMRQAFEAAFGTLEDAFEPSEDYLATKMDEVENGEIVASSLMEVSSKKKAKTVGIQTSVDTSGHVRVIKQRGKGFMPQGTEELRTVLRIEGNMWTFLASKYKNRQFFKDMNPQIWQDYTNWLLGERVYLMQIPVPQGKGGKMEQQALRPPWVVMLNFEFELRREAVKRAFKESRDLKSTLQEVMECAQLKEQFFTSPIALQGKGSRNPNWQGGWQYEQPWKWHKGDGKPQKGREKGKGKDKGKSKRGGKSELASRTPDGRFICFAYSGSGCKGDCGMVHCCQVRGCLGPHPTWKHWQEHFSKSSPTSDTKTD